VFGAHFAGECARAGRNDTQARVTLDQSTEGRRAVANEQELSSLFDESRNDPGALDRLFASLYRELVRTAEQELARGRPGETLTATALVHEVYLKLSQARGLAFEGRRHFFGVAARAMRQVIVDVARAKAAEKRGGGAISTTLTHAAIVSPDFVDRYLVLDDALERLTALDERLAKIIELRFFAGLSIEETARIVDASPRTVKREWQRAREWLQQELAGRENPLGPPSADEPGPSV
jgi:RNA polymerase sigma factor (TIGR02999 family)